MNWYVIKAESWYVPVAAPKPLHEAQAHGESLGIPEPGGLLVLEPGTWQAAYGPCSEDEAVLFVEDVTGRRPQKI